jgi:hypothetical protein
MIALEVMEMASFDGIVDLISDSALAGALPSDLEENALGFPLLLAASLRLACHPARAGIYEGTADDRLACNELRLVLESAFEAVIDNTKQDRMPNKPPLFAVDIALNHAVTVLTAQIHDKSSGMSQNDREVLTKTLHKTLTSLHRTGVALANNLFGCQPQSTASSLYNRFGYAESLDDVFNSTRMHEYQRAGLGMLQSNIAPRKVATVGKRQKKVLELFGAVEAYLRAPKLKPGTEDDQPVNATAATDAVAASRTQAFDAAFSSFAYDTDEEEEQKRQASSEKAKPKTKKQVSSKKNGKKTLQKDTSVKKSQNDNELAKFLEAHCESKLHKYNLTEAATRLGNLLQAGSCYYTSMNVDAGVFAVSKFSLNTCASCSSQFHAVEALAIGGMLNSCTRCFSPRCLKCVDADVSIFKNCKNGNDIPKHSVFRLGKCLKCRE